MYILFAFFVGVIGLKWPRLKTGLIITVVAAFVAVFWLFLSNGHSDVAYDLSMQGVKITEEGKRFEEGIISVKGRLTEESGTTHLTFSDITIMGFEYRGVDGLDGVVLHYPMGYSVISALVYDSGTSNIISFNAYISDNTDWCVVTMGGRHQEFYFVGSTAENPDYLSIIEPFVS